MPAKRHQIDQFRTEHGSQTVHAVIIDPVEACSDGSGSELKKLRSALQRGGLESCSGHSPQFAKHQRSRCATDYISRQICGAGPRR